MSRTIFNEKATGHQTGTYPLFFGEQLGTYDTMSRNYPKLFELYNQQMAQIWNSQEVNIDNDRVEMATYPKDVVDIMTKTIMWQHQTDSLAHAAVSELLPRHITNPELKSLVAAWGLFEDIHEQSYSDIVESIFPKPLDILSEMSENINLTERSRILIDTFDSLYNLEDDAPVSEKRKAMLLAMTAFYAMESISFMASFTITFTIGHIKMFTGVANRVRLIARDEQLHQHFAYEILRIMRDVEKYPEWNEMLPQMKEIIDTVRQQEMDWVEYILKDGEAVGITKNFLRDAVDFFATPVYHKLGIDAPFELTWDNPVKHLNEWFDTSLIQTASQEIQQTSYVIGALRDDMSDDMDLDFKF